MVVDGRISCNQCGHRHGSFMRSCPRCGHPYNSSSSSFSYANGQKSATKRRVSVGKGSIIVIAIIVVAGIISVLAILNLYLPFILHSSTDIINNSLKISNDISSPSSSGGLSQQPLLPVQPKYNETNLKLYALDQINQDRKKNNLPPVELSQNQAVQIHAGRYRQKPDFAPMWNLAIFNADV